METVFDDTFRTIQERMIRLLIPVINEVFKTSYGNDVEIELLYNEHHIPKKRTTDSHIRIGNKRYHIECQSNDDYTMVVRMFEYDYMIAMEHIAREKGRYKLIFPKSCVIYLRENKNTTSDLYLDVCMPDGGQITYHVPTIKVSDYSLNDIFKKGLLAFLPFYIMRYETDAVKIENSDELINKLAEEYEYICNRLEKVYEGCDKNDELVRLMELITHISNYIFQNQEKTRERIGDLVGGKVIDLNIDKQLKESYDKGESHGIEKGLEKGMEFVLSNGHTVDEVAKMFNATREAVTKVNNKRLKKLRSAN